MTWLWVTEPASVMFARGSWLSDRGWRSAIIRVPLRWVRCNSGLSWCEWSPYPWARDALSSPRETGVSGYTTTSPYPVETATSQRYRFPGFAGMAMVAQWELIFPLFHEGIVPPLSAPLELRLFTISSECIDIELRQAYSFCLSQKRTSVPHVFFSFPARNIWESGNAVCHNLVYIHGEQHNTG